MQMNYNLSRLNFPNTLLDDLHGLQREDVLCDLQLICDNGDVWIHRAVLEVWNLWWCCLLKDSTTNVILLPGFSILEVEKFVGKNYGEFNFPPNNVIAMTCTKFFGEIHFYKSVILLGNVV